MALCLVGVALRLGGVTLRLVGVALCLTDRGLCFGVTCFFLGLTLGCLLSGIRSESESVTNSLDLNSLLLTFLPVVPLSGFLPAFCFRGGFLGGSSSSLDVSSSPSYTGCPSSGISFSLVLFELTSVSDMGCAVEIGGSRGLTLVVSDQLTTCGSVLMGDNGAVPIGNNDSPVLIENGSELIENTGSASMLIGDRGSMIGGTLWIIGLGASTLGVSRFNAEETPGLGVGYRGLGLGSAVLALPGDEVLLFLRIDSILNCCVPPFLSLSLSLSGASSLSSEVVSPDSDSLSLLLPSVEAAFVSLGLFTSLVRGTAG